MKKAFFILIISCLFFQPSFSTYYHGGEIKWECLPNGNFRFLLKQYRECYTFNGGATAMYSSYETIQTTVPGFPSIIVSEQSGWPRDISPICNLNPAFPHITCTGMSNGTANMGAVQEHSYSSDAAYPNGIHLTGIPPANGWLFHLTSCCRNPTGNLLGADSYGYRLRAIMYPYNNQNVSTCFDWSPSFSETPQAVFCTGYSETFNYNVWDNEHDSLQYSWGQLLSNNGVPVVSYVYGYSYNNPLPGSTVNSNNISATVNTNTGEVSFTSFTLGNFMTCFKVTSFKCGIKVAEVFREIKVIIAQCGTNSPPVVSPPFKDSNGQYTLYIDTVYAGQQVDFQIQGYDFEFLPNGTPQTMELSTSGMQFGAIIPGVGTNPPGMTDTTGCLRPPCATLFPAPNPPTQPFTSQFGINTQFYWQTDCQHLATNAGCGSSQNIYNFVFKIFDDFCPVPGQSIKTVTIVILTKPAIEPPDLHTISFDSTGFTKLFWNKSIDTLNSFNRYIIYRSSSSSGGFQKIDSIYNINITSYTDSFADIFNSPKYYYIRTVSGCDSNQYSAPSDTMFVGNYDFLPPPFLHTLTYDSTGETTLKWNQPIDSLGIFKTYLIYRAVQNSPFFQLIDTVCSININSYIDNSAQATISPKCYFIKTKSGGSINYSYSVHSDTLCIGIYGSINNNNKINQITCIPNPTTGKLQISYYSAVSGEVELKISDITGKQVQSGKYNSKLGDNTIQLDLSGLNDGVYFYSLKIDNEVVTKKFVIQK